LILSIAFGYVNLKFRRLLTQNKGLPMFESLGPVDNTTLRERVYRTLKQAILEGRFSPGETLPTRSLAEVLGTSVMPVRDAMLRLSAEGGVEVLPNRAARLPVLSRESIAELYEVRLNLEGLAAALAANRITPDELAAVEQAFAGMMQASERNDVSGFLRDNQLFHFSIYGAAQSYHLFPIIEALWLKGGPLLRPFVKGSRAQTRLFEGHDSHARALEGLTRRDPAMARQGIVDDLANAARWYSTHFVEEERGRAKAV
jgi:DNA-binding GntR family transcriptional regulator